MAVTTGYPAQVRTVSNGAHHALVILWVAFVLAPLCAGIDKFFDFLTNWDQYLSPIVTHYVNGNLFMHAVGVIEIVAAVIVALTPRVGAYIVAIWLLGIIANLISMHAYYDIALRDFGLFLGAIALARLAQYFKTLESNQTVPQMPV